MSSDNQFLFEWYKTQLEFTEAPEDLFTHTESPDNKSGNPETISVAEVPISAIFNNLMLTSNHVLSPEDQEKRQKYMKIYSLVEKCKIISNHLLRCPNDNEKKISKDTLLQILRDILNSLDQVPI